MGGMSRMADASAAVRCAVRCVALHDTERIHAWKPYHTLPPPLSPRSKTWPAAEACFTRVIETDPAVMEAWNKRATLYYLQLRYQEAIHDCERVLSLCPYHFGALSGLGLIYRALNRPKDALHWCQRALQVHPGLDAIRVLADSCERQLNEP